jgi:hypothetical protein
MTLKRTDGSNAKSKMKRSALSLAEEPIVRFYARRHRCPRPGSIEFNELIQSRRCSSAVCGRSISSYRPHTEALGASAQMRCVSC